MKPIKLEIEGLNSFETKQVLDFESLGTGVFGIFGKTGSGKSTLLDAITLALYGKVERTKQNIDFINTKSSKAIVTFIFEIYYSGKNRKFMVTRTFSKKKSGTELDSSASLYEINGETQSEIEEGTNKVNDKIFEIIGLGVNEFAKCIALPQGEFSAFLSAKPSERTEIMSNIFDLTRFGDKLSYKVKERVNEYDKEIASLSAGRELVAYATDEVLSETSSGLGNVKEELNEASKTLEEKNEKYSKGKADFEKLKSLAEINKKLDELALEKENIEKLETELSKSECANAIRSDYEKLAKDKQDEKDLTEKIAELNEIKLKKASELKESEIDFEEFKKIYETKIAELTSKKARLVDLQKFEEEKISYEKEKEDVQNKQTVAKNELNAEQENNNYIVSNLTTIQGKITEIDEFIEANKPDVDLSYALEQTKGIESELILIEDFHKKVEELFDQTESDLKVVQEEYNSAIKQEQEFIAKREQIRNSISVAFEDVDTTDFKKLRSCDKELEGMLEVQINVDKINELVLKLKNENQDRLGFISSLGEQIDNEQRNLANIESQINEKEKELEDSRESREELLGENVISMISNHLKIGDYCPVCSNRVIQKVYGETNDTQAVDSEIDAKNNNIKMLRFERDKVLVSLISLKSRNEYERTQIEENNKEIAKLEEGKNLYYQKFVDNNDDSEENFNTLRNLLQKTSDSLESLIALQDNIREAELRVIIEKIQAGTKISLYKNYQESLLDIIYDLQKKQAEREFAIFNVNEKYENLKEYKKQIAEGKNTEIEIDTKKEERTKLRDEQMRLTEEKSASDAKLAGIRTNIEVLAEKLNNCEKQISSLSAKIISSGVPENVSLEEENLSIDKEIARLKFDYENKQIQSVSCKENLSRTENEYNVKSSIILEKKAEILRLEEKVNKGVSEGGFASVSELESCFADQSVVKNKQSKVNEYKDNVRLLEAQKISLEKEHLSEISEAELDNLTREINTLSETVKKLSENLGKASADLDRIKEANKKLKEIDGRLEIAKHKFDLAKDLSNVLRGKALAEYVCEEYLQEITSSANQKLGILMDGRYTLKFENKEFYVEDNFNDGKVRPASTLSGGETFIVSLSLALSISDAISLLSARSMDFFFLDEGFGTLDEELCSVVISSLYKLESQNLRIGLISHVTELENSIKNKVLVTKGMSGSKITIEHSL